MLMAAALRELTGSAHCPSLRLAPLSQNLYDRVLRVLWIHRPVHQHRRDTAGILGTVRRATPVPQEGVSNGQLESSMSTSGRRSRPGPGQHYRVPKLSTRVKAPPAGLALVGSPARPKTVLGHQGREYPVALVPKV
jgi:hypothetical protein